jgi:N-acetyl-alpha-D-muramate 1-phosphate uridylyltransferase
MSGPAAESPRKAMILAAGRGERMRPLTDATPKPLLRVAGKPLIQYHVEALARAGIDRLVVNLNWLGAQIREHLGDGARFGVSIVYSDEQPAALETAGGIFRALRHLQPGPFLVVNGDIFCDVPFWTLRLEQRADAHLVLVPNPPQHPGGDFGLENGQARPRREGAPSFTFAGVGLYRESFFRGCSDGAFPLKPLLLRSMEAGICTAQVHRGLWEDVGTPQRLADLDARLGTGR